MKQTLFRDAFVIFVFWFVVAYLVAGFPLRFVPYVVVGVLLIWVVGACAGLALAWAVHRSAFHRARSSLRLATDEEYLVRATIMDGDEAHTLYEVSLPLPAAPSMGKATGNPAHELPWWGRFAGLNPEHAAVIDECFAVMQSRPGMPAGIDKHVGATLVEHSTDVMRVAVEMSKTWQFEGIKNATGAVLVPLRDPEHGSHQLGKDVIESCPILLVAAFAHDVGKVTCLVWDKNTGTGKMLPNHGEAGAALLRRMPSVHELAMEDRDTLLMAVTYYHWLSHIPTVRWLSDRTRSVTALLGEADSASAFNRERARQVSQPGNTGDVASESGSEDMPPRPSTPPDSSTGTDAPSEPESEPKFTLENGASAMDGFVEAITAPDAVNSKRRDRRIAWKHDGWLYIQAKLLVEAISDFASDASICDTRRKEFDTALLACLDEQGVLFRGNPPRELSACEWPVTSSAPGTEPRPYNVWVVRADVTPITAGIADCDHPPVFVENDASIRAVMATMATIATEASALPPPATQSDSSTIHQDEQPPANNGPGAHTGNKIRVTVEALVGEASAVPLPKYVDIRTTDNGTFAVFDIEGVRTKYIVDLDDLPVGIGRLKKAPKLAVRLP